VARFGHEIDGDAFLAQSHGYHQLQL
jgi:hypothetical protein